MKRFAFLLLLGLALWSPGAKAQVLGDVYSVASPAHVRTFSSSASSSITSSIVHRIIRATCNAACFLNINASGVTMDVTKITGVYLPANTPTLFSVTPGAKVSVIGDSAAGVLHVQELSR